MTWQREFLEQNYSTGMLVAHAGRCLGQALGLPVRTVPETGGYRFCCGSWTVYVPRPRAEQARRNGPYRVDSLLLQELLKQGLLLDAGQSPYLRRCLRLSLELSSF